MDFKKLIEKQVRACIEHLNDYFQITIPLNPTIQFSNEPNSKKLGHYLMAYQKQTGRRLFSKSKFLFNLGHINDSNYKKYLQHVIPHQVSHYACFYLMKPEQIVKRKDQHKTKLFKQITRAFKTRQDISQAQIQI